MVKARMRKKVAAANQAATEVDGGDDPASKEEADAELDATMSKLAGHQKRKVTKRAKFLEKIRVATANKMKKSGKKKGASAAFSDFATLESTLGDIARKGMSPGKKDKVRVLRAKARTKLAATESQRMQQVLAHPTFQENPIAAISNHIAASLKAKPRRRRSSLRRWRPRRRRWRVARRAKRQSRGSTSTTRATRWRWRPRRARAMRRRGVSASEAGTRASACVGPTRRKARAGRKAPSAGRSERRRLGDHRGGP